MYFEATAGFLYWHAHCLSKAETRWGRWKILPNEGLIGFQKDKGVPTG